MSYEELVERVRDKLSGVRISKTVGHIAFQFNVEGEGNGIFYVELYDGKIYVEPYEYYDRNVIIESTAYIILEMLEGGLKPRVAYAQGMIKVYGSADLLDILPFGCKV